MNLEKGEGEGKKKEERLQLIKGKVETQSTML